MARDILHYDKMVESALRGVVREALIFVSKNGLPGNHHFYLTFRTDYPGVDISETLHAQYPVDMTVVLQHQYWGLEVNDDHFVVNLSFSNVPERLQVPYAAMISFVDPSVKFGLQFQPAEGEAAASGAATDAGKAKPKLAKPAGDGKPIELKPHKAETKAETAKPEAAKPEAALPATAKADDAPEAAEAAPDGQAAGEEPGKVVSLDAFRKK
ncbi:MAG TPA: ClpXP protease specificity-enhancing factor SspB [Alphaproteobacteria bacterium]|jgi:hypothetical protein